MVFSVGIISPLITRGQIINMQTNNNALTQRTSINFQTEPGALDSWFPLLLRLSLHPAQMEPKNPLGSPCPRRHPQEQTPSGAAGYPLRVPRELHFLWLWACSPGSRIPLRKRAGPSAGVAPASVCAGARSEIKAGGWPWPNSPSLLTLERSQRSGWTPSSRLSSPP